jgi:hypothetical protein
MDSFLFFSGIGLGGVAAYFAATQLFKKVWNNQVTHLKLAGFLVTFLVIFVGLLAAYFYIVASQLDFGR